MNYGTPKAAGGTTLAATGLTLLNQISIVLAAVIIVIAIAIGIRWKWRKNKSLNQG